MQILSFSLFRTIVLSMVAALLLSWLVLGEDPRHQQQIPQTQLRIPSGAYTGSASMIAPTPPPTQPLPNGAFYGQDAKHDSSLPLSVMAAAPEHKAPTPFQESPWEEAQERARTRRSGPFQDPIVQTTYGSVAAVPAPSRVIEGAHQYNGVLDPNADVGPTHIVQMINFRTQIWNKHTGAAVYGPFDNNVLFSGFDRLPNDGVDEPCQIESGVDPVVLHDQLADRWLLTYLVAPENGGGMCLAVSTSGDPTSTFHRYYFALRGGFYDYPKFGIWPDGYYMTAHDHSAPTRTKTIVVFERDKMLNGAAAHFIEFPLVEAYTLTPSDLDGTTLPPAGAPNYVGSLPQPGDPPHNTLIIRKVQVNWANPGNSSVTPVNVTVAAYTPGARPPHAGGNPLWELADPLMFRLSYRNFGTHQMLLGSHHVNVNGISGIRWYEIRSPDGTPVVHQQGTYAPPDNKHRWIPSIAMDRQGNIMLGYNIVDATSEPGIAYTGRLAGDSVGQMTQGEGVVATATGTYGGDRWGDYASMVVDPGDDCTFWFTSQYLNNSNVRSRIAGVKFPSCSSPSPTPTPMTTDTNVALNKTVTGSAPCQSTEGASNVVDGSYTTKWCSFGTPQQLTVDLGANYTLSYFMLTHAGNEHPFYITRDFSIEVSINNTQWSPVVTVTGNKNNTTRHFISPTTARYVRLNVITASQDSNSGQPARIYEFEGYGRPVQGVTVFSDNFETNSGWMVNPSGTDTATLGQWERGDPASTNSNGPKQLGTTTSGVNDLITGRLAGASAGDYDLDGGVSSIRSPIIALPTGATITLTFKYYLAHGSNASSSDYLRVKIMGATTTTVLERLASATNVDGTWATGTVNLSSYSGQNVRILFEAADSSTASLVEAAIDDVTILTQ